MNSRQELEKLFTTWESTFPEHSGKFIRDGIINDELYQTAKVKICFLTKEPNDEKQQTWNLSDTLNTEFKGIFSIRIAEWSYGIQNNFPPIESIPATPEQLQHWLKKTAVVNVKKTGGRSSSDMAEIVKHAQQNKQYLLEQIRLIKPDILIAGVGKTKIFEHLFDVKSIKSEDKFDIVKWEGIKVINFYHPSCRISPSKSYSLLQNAVNSEKFRNL
ncbi:MAG: hypothetical protein J0L62_15750 [Bacteroidetes bacterium]|nr:hypothetical protein [Bacteroidota bacterium]